jgi:hypothetical protein
MSARRSSVNVDDLEAAAEPTAEELTTGKVSKIDPRDAALSQYQEFKVKPGQRNVPEHDQHLRVGHVPRDRCVTWATDPRIDNGRSIAMFRGLGFRVVEMDEVTNNPNESRKLFVKHFEEGPNGSVAMGGGVLMIGYRQYRDQRKAAAREESKSQVVQQQNKLDSMGIRHGGSITRGGLTEV